ncbi:MAG: hypothetical protein GWM88_12720, partial [Pseudomonadales bacterium]|nr:hypothetical protein [Pseudomonadales bacterium]NIX08816.1 hypothetical protein [Pseudomonadales bacterium]
MEERRDRRQLRRDASGVERFRLDPRAADEHVSEHDVHHGSAGDRPSVRDDALKLPRQVVGVQVCLLREDREDLPVRIARRLDEEVDTVRVTEEDLVRPHEGIAQRVTVPEAVLICLEHGDDVVLAILRLAGERVHGPRVLL